MTKYLQNFYTFMKIVIKQLFTISIITIPTFFFGYKGQSVEMGIALTAGTFGAVFLNLDKFISFKGGGFEAKLKEANTTIDKAMLTIDKFKQVLIPMLSSNLYSITYSGRVRSFVINGNLEQNDKTRNDIVNIINDLEIYKLDPKIVDYIDTYDRLTTWTAFSIIFDFIKNDYTDDGTLLYKDPKKYDDCLNQLTDLKEKYYNDTYLPTTEEIITILNKYSLESNIKLNKLLNDYQLRLNHSKQIRIKKS